MTKIRRIIESMITEAPFGFKGVPFPSETPNEFAYLDFAKYIKKNEKKMIKFLKPMRPDSMFKALQSLWKEWDKKTNKGEYSNIRGNKFGRELVKMLWKDNLLFDKSGNRITKLKEDKKKVKVSKDYTKGLSRKKKKYGSKDAMEKEIEKYRGTDKYKKDWDADYKKDKKTGKKTRVKTKRSAASKAFAKMYGEGINEDYSQRARNFRVNLRMRMKDLKIGGKIKAYKMTFTKEGPDKYSWKGPQKWKAEAVVQAIKKAAVNDIMKWKGGARGAPMVNAFLKFEGKLNEKGKGLWHNIHKKRKRGEAPAKKGTKAYNKAAKAIDRLKEEAPPGMEDVVLALKKKKDITNPYAVAWAMYNKKNKK